MALTMQNIPIGYGTRRGTYADALAASPVPVDPEFAQRLEGALYVMRVLRGHDVGVGEIGRKVNPTKPGAAAPGNSFHEPHMGSKIPYQGKACAVDIVIAQPGGTHRIWTDWSKVPAQARGESLCGLHASVGKPGDPYPKGEPHHWQPVEVDGFATWRAAGSPPLRPFALEPVDPIEPDLPPEVDMAKLPKIRVRGRAKQWALLPLHPDTNIELGIDKDAPFVIDMTPQQIAALEAHLGYQLAPTKSGE